jgi:GNAT superfamily N-acetyltransferase
MKIMSYEVWLAESTNISEQQDNLKQLVDDIQKMGVPSFIDRRDIIVDDGVVVNANVFDGMVWINLLTMSDVRGQGKATKVLDAIIQLADQHHVTLALDAKPYGTTKGLTKSQLMSWYQRKGFQKTGWGSEMVRTPQL